jgi:hypothetical protein
MNKEVAANIGMRGRVFVATYQWKGDFESSLACKPDETRAAHNILCDTGLTVLANAVMWSSVEDQNANMGSPFTAMYAAPIYGAIGTGTTTPTGHDSALTSGEVRAIVTGAGYAAAYFPTPALFSWLFLFGVPPVGITIAECGVYFQATSTVSSGSLFNHALISPTITQSTTQIFTLNISVSIGNT